MPFDEECLHNLVSLVEKQFPGWKSFRNPDYEKAEVTYKQRSVELARELLSREELTRLLDDGGFDDIIGNFDQVGKSNNLLYRSVPMSGDLGILYSSKLDKEEFSNVLLDLLHGDGDAPERLGRFSKYASIKGLPNRWPFPTYFLFATHPETEILVKPKTTKKFLELIDHKEVFVGTPEEESYRRIREIASELKDALEPYGARDMVDVQGFIWVCAQQTGNNVEKKPKRSHIKSAFTEETFSLLTQLRENPTRAFYTEHKEAFQRDLERPFQSLFLSVADQLPDQVKEKMETRKRVFSQIPKNDWAHGGAWDFYWGAFYPKGGKRTEDAQLYLSVNHECLEFGFYIGEYGRILRERFLRNCRSNRLALSEISDSFGPSLLMYRRPEGRETFERQVLSAAWATWLYSPDMSIWHIGSILPKENVLSRDKNELAELIRSAFAQLFPLVLLTLSDDPMPEILEYLEDGNGIVDAPNETYTLETLAEDTGLAIDVARRWIQAIYRKGQAILYGPPGTGKTFVAEKMAKHLISDGDGFVDLVQFHPAYAYEDFVQGIRPQGRADGGLDYPVIPGRFLDFCRRARSCKDDCVLIIDEINRANLSRVFGELMYLLEYRRQKITLSGGREFDIPQNVRLIGTMNTADRSIALVDHALRRRFAFLNLRPNYDVLADYHLRQQTGFETTGLVGVLQQLNVRIDDPHYEVGISFFMCKDLTEDIEDIWNTEIEPYLEEYFFDRPDVLDQFRWVNVSDSIMGKKP